MEEKSVQVVEPKTAVSAGAVEQVEKSASTGFLHFPKSFFLFHFFHELPWSKKGQGFEREIERAEGFVHAGDMEKAKSTIDLLEKEEKMTDPRLEALKKEIAFMESARGEKKEDAAREIQGVDFPEEKRPKVFPNSFLFNLYDEAPNKDLNSQQIYSRFVSGAAEKAKLLLEDGKPAEAKAFLQKLLEKGFSSPDIEALPFRIAKVERKQKIEEFHDSEEEIKKFVESKDLVSAEDILDAFAHYPEIVAQTRKLKEEIELQKQKLYKTDKQKEFYESAKTIFQSIKKGDLDGAKKLLEPFVFDDEVRTDVQKWAWKIDAADKEQGGEGFDYESLQAKKESVKKSEEQDLQILKTVGERDEAVVMPSSMDKTPVGSVSADSKISLASFSKSMEAAKEESEKEQEQKLEKEKEKEVEKEKLILADKAKQAKSKEDRSFVEKNLPTLSNMLKKEPKKKEDVDEEESIKPKKQEGKVHVGFWNYFMRVSQTTRIYFTSQLSVFLNSDIPLVEALQIIGGQTQSGVLKKIIKELIDDIGTKGKFLSDSMAKYPFVFPEMYVNLIAVGEQSGALAQVLKELAAQEEAYANLIRKVKGAMFYPAFMVLLSIALLIGILTFFVPMLQDMYASSNTDLPALTQMVIDMSEFVILNYQAMISSLIFVVVVGFGFIGFTSMGKVVKDMFIFNVPIFGNLILKKNVATFAGNTSLLLRNGVLLTNAFDVVKKTMGSILYEREIERVRKHVVAGGLFSEALGVSKEGKKLKASYLFPLDVGQMVAVGEYTGKIEAMLSKIHDNYAAEVDDAVKSLSTLLEPILIVAVGGMIGTLLMAIMLPFFNIGSVIGNI